MNGNLSIKNLSLWIGQEKIINNFSFNAKNGEIVALIGPNGSGKSTLMKGIFNHFSITKKIGSVFFDKKNITNFNPYELSKNGFFIAMQNPIELNGVKNLDFLKLIVKKNNNSDFKQTFDKITKTLNKLSMNNELLVRDVNVGFSGGQKKKNEILQSLLLEPKVLFLDEIDSGLDVDGIKTVASVIKSNSKETITFVISHQLEFFKYLKPQKVIVLLNGEIKKTGTNKLLNSILKNGFDQFGEIKFKKEDPFLTCKTKA